MRLADLITSKPITVRPDDSIRKATIVMCESSIGFLPVTDSGRVLGVVTDRDIVLRGVAQGYDPQTTFIRHVMTPDPIQLQITDELETALDLMAAKAIGRLLVTDKEGNLVGVLTAGDLAMACRGDERAGYLKVALHQRNHRQSVPIPPPDAQFVSE